MPSWAFDNNGRDVYVKCNPILPDDIELDDSNNIHIYRTFNISDIWGKDIIEIDVYNRTYKIETKKITLQPNQEIYILNSGISRVNTKNMLDISVLSTVFIHIQLEM